MNLTLHISDLRTLKSVPSASGIAHLNNEFALVGDNSPYLFFLNEDFNLIKKIEIFSTLSLNENTIAKKEKPDFEAFESISDHELMILGSGSRIPQRALCIIVDLEDQSQKTFEILEVYRKLLALPEMNGAELNIEALASTAEHLYLFNRSNNLIFRYVKSEFILDVRNHTSVANPEIYSFTLLKLNGIESGFSGATITSDETKIIFTSSVEDTDNAYDDGEVLGSFIGVIDIKTQLNSLEFEATEISIKDKKLKIESVTILNESPDGINLVLVTDNDGLPSEIINARLIIS